MFLLTMFCLECSCNVQKPFPIPLDPNVFFFIFYICTGLLKAEGTCNNSILVPFKVSRLAKIRPRIDTTHQFYNGTHLIKNQNLVLVQKNYRSLFVTVIIKSHQCLFELWFSQGIRPVVGLLGHTVILFLVF